MFLRHPEKVRLDKRFPTWGTFASERVHLLRSLINLTLRHKNGVYLYS